MFNFLRGPRPPSRRAKVAAASGGSSSVMMTRTRLLPFGLNPERSGAGPNLQERLLDDAARGLSDRARGRPGCGDDDEEGDEER